MQRLRPDVGSGASLHHTLTVATSERGSTRAGFNVFTLIGSSSK